MTDSTSQTDSGRNRLAGTNSPYLLQHADNPVDWHPWGEEAFRKAREEDKPVFLSIGYSTCHWCHVMEEESFEDEEVARLLNEVAVPVKVDREERPDVDGLYMSVCQAMTGSGGWPLNLFLTPDKKPFFAGTYIPKRSRGGRLGMDELLPRIAEVWKERRDRVEETGDRVLGAVRQQEGAPGGLLDRELLDLAYGQLSDRYDAAQGGFGSAPKFPSPHNLLFLLRHAHRTGEDRALEMAATTLRRMRRGGIFDQVGYGFHRYSTDARWLLPHFEKMLYDQALLALAYVEAGQAAEEPEFLRTAREVFRYVLRDLRSPEGGFHSAEDADSEGGEGAFYVWSEEELKEVLGERDFRLAKAAWGVRGAGNYTEEATGERTGKNVLHRPRPLADVAEEQGVPEGELRERLEEGRRELLRARNERPRPGLDDKVLTDWNGLMIAALARGATVLQARREAAEGAAVLEAAGEGGVRGGGGDSGAAAGAGGQGPNAPTESLDPELPGPEELLTAARKAAGFLLEAMRDDAGRLLHRYRNAEAAVPATADDYAGLTLGLVELYEATGEARWLREALRLQEEFADRCWDPEDGGFFLAGSDARELPVSRKEAYDGALPSSNSLALWNLRRLARLTGRPELDERADGVEAAFSSQVSRTPSAHTAMLLGLDFRAGAGHEVVVAAAGDGEGLDAEAEEMLRILRGGFRPRTVHLLRTAKSAEELAEVAPFTREQGPVEGGTAAYVCRDFACEAPTTDPEEMRELLDG